MPFQARGIREGQLVASFFFLSSVPPLSLVGHADVICQMEGVLGDNKAHGTIVSLLCCRKI